MAMRAVVLGMALAAISLTAAAQTTPARTGLTNFDGRPRAAPFSEDIFGLHLDDEYRWMEDPAAASEWESWIRAASEHTRAQLAALPGRNRLADRLQAISRTGVAYFSLSQAGGRLFYQRLDPDSAIAKLVVREANGAERVLFDPAANVSGPVSINNYSVSGDGKFIAFHLAQGGGEVGVMHFMDVDTGRELPDRLTPIWGEESVSWIDDQTVLYTRMDPDSSDPLQNMDTRLHRMGTPANDDVVLISPGRGVDAREFPGAFYSPLSDWTIGTGGGARADYRSFVARDADVRAGRPNWAPLAGYSDNVNAGDVRGDYAYLLTTHSQPNGEIVRVDLRHPDLAHATVVVAAGDLVLTSLATTRDGLYVAGQRDGVSHLLFLRDAQGAAWDVTLPFSGALDNFASNGDASGVTFEMSGWLQNARYFSARGGRVTPLGVEAATYAGVSNFEEINEETVSADGTHVPLFILAPKGVARDHNAPAIVYGYGSYGVSQTPGYSPNVYAWLEEGGVFAFCAVRGGGERGRAWHEGGRERNKPNAHADFDACAHRLIDLGYTNPSRLGATGVSAGGLLVPPAALKEPHLFAAVVPRVSILNPTRLSAAENGPNQYAEMGDPATADGFHALYEEDSYQWLARASDSPDWMLTVGLNDRRVTPWMSAKFAARALARFGNHHLVLIRTDPEAGHGIGSTRDQVVEERADIYAFFLNRFGAPDFQATTTH
jgi:prolyl oligopeptidase